MTTAGDRLRHKRRAAYREANEARRLAGDDFRPFRVTPAAVRTVDGLHRPSSQCELVDGEWVYRAAGVTP